MEEKKIIDNKDEDDTLEVDLEKDLEEDENYKKEKENSYKKKSKQQKTPILRKSEDLISNKTVNKNQDLDLKALLENTWRIAKENKRFLFLIFLGFFAVYSFFYGLWKIPFIGFGISKLTYIGFSDYLFISGVSILGALLLTLWNHERKMYVGTKNNSVSGVAGGTAALAAAVCPVCNGIVITALGASILTIPTNFLIPYLTLIKTFSIGLLIFAVFLKADIINTRTCISFSNVSIKKEKKETEEHILFRNNYLMVAVVLIIILLFVNQLTIPGVFGSLSIGSMGTASLGEFNYGSKTTLKPMPLAAGEQPKIPSYKSKVKSLPTISELSITPSTGDPAQDLLNNVIPKGTPWYGKEAGVSFDDPITSQKLWANGKNIQLDAVEQERWNRIANSFTCDYCCGSPQNPTIITKCGCAHAAAAQGMAKWFIKNYGNKYSDEEIYGEMARWYALWYPKGTIERIILEAQ